LKSRGIIAHKKAVWQRQKTATQSAGLQVAEVRDSTFQRENCLPQGANFGDDLVPMFSLFFILIGFLCNHSLRRFDKSWINRRAAEVARSAQIRSFVEMVEGVEVVIARLLRNNC